MKWIKMKNIHLKFIVNPWHKISCKCISSSFKVRYLDGQALTLCSLHQKNTSYMTKWAIILSSWWWEAGEERGGGGGFVGYTHCSWTADDITVTGKYNNSIISAIIISNYYKLLHISTYLPKRTLPFWQLIPREVWPGTGTGGK